MAGIYLHIPFCKQRCSYCDFHFSTNFQSYRKELIAALCREIVLRKHEIHTEVQTIYFGGGTPSLLENEELSLILETIRMHYTLAKTIEISLEANPEDVCEEKLVHWKQEGINRLSIGLQSFKESDMRWMNRAHLASDGIKAVQLAQKFGFDNITIDLIYGLPNLSLVEWKNHLQLVIDLGITHISAYCLTIEPKTALHHQVKQRQLITANEDEQSEQFELMVSFLKKNGFEHYEISNFAKNGVYSKHNTAYWQGIHYLGIGPSAHSFNGEQRRWNISNNTVYYKNVGVNETWFTTETLTASEQWNELFLTGLRTKWGVSKAKIIEMGGFKPSEENLLQQFLEANDILETETYLMLSEKGKLRADGIASAFFRID
jgi:oxygen-independent coproporphyrinogen-3 oxidase